MIKYISFVVGIIATVFAIVNIFIATTVHDVIGWEVASTMTFVVTTKVVVDLLKKN